MKPVIGFIGLGQMGSAMVERLQARGYSLNVIANRSRGAIDAALARGAREHDSARELAAASDIVMLCMDTSDSVESRMLGADGVIAGLSEGKLVIDFGTSLPASTRRLGEAVAAAGGQMLDAPLGRTPAHARQGQLNIMCSGDEASFERARATLDELGENVFDLGVLGTGGSIKLINNFFGMTLANAMAEAFANAEAAGIDTRRLHQVMAAGPLHCAMMDFVAAYALDADPEKLQFSIANACKDIGYYTRMVAELGIDSAMAPCARNAMTRAVDDGRGDQQVSQMVDYYRALAAAGRD